MPSPGAAVLRRRRLLSADDRGAPLARRAARYRAGDRGLPEGRALRSSVRRHRPDAGRSGEAARPSRVHRSCEAGRRRRGRRHRPAQPDPRDAAWEQRRRCRAGSSQRFGVPIGIRRPARGVFSPRSRSRKAGARPDHRRVGGSRMAWRRNRMACRRAAAHPRDKATSNICTAQALLANIAAFSAVLPRPQWDHRESHGACTRTRGCGRAPARELGSSAQPAVFRHAPPRRGGTIVAFYFIGRSRRRPIEFSLSRRLARSTSLWTKRPTATTSRRSWACCQRGRERPPSSIDRESAGRLDVEYPAGLARTSPFLTHIVFTASLGDRDYAAPQEPRAEGTTGLDTSMIPPLGSCTMNAQRGLRDAARSRGPSSRRRTPSCRSSI